MENINTMPYAIFAYTHHNRKIAAMVTLRCKTDFALRTDLLQQLGNQLAMHAAASGVLDLESAWVLDTSKKVSELIGNVSKELGEPVVVSQVQVQG